MTEANSEDLPDLRVGLLAIRQEFLNLSELKHCLHVRTKLIKKGRRFDDFGEILVQERYLTPENLEYLHMIAGAEPAAKAVTLEDIEAEFQSQLAEIKQGAFFGPYKILGELGRGGMGVVLRALDSERDEEIALKILIGRDQASVRDIERFKKEATVMMPLLHRGIVKILDVGRVKGLDFIAMEYIRGKSLKELVGKDSKIDPITALSIIRSAAEAVSFIHAQGIIHRDIKPENIMVRDRDNSAVLMDFGLAGWDKIEILSGRGSIGTPMYQPPEQAEVGGPFGKISEASDVYGLGATLYFLLSCHHPFTGRSVKEVRDKIKTVPPAPPSTYREDLSEVVEALVLRCMRKRQSERFATPKQLIEAIDKVLRLLGSARRQRPQVKKSLGKNQRLSNMRSRRKTQGVAALAPAKKQTRKYGNSKSSRRSGENNSVAKQQWFENPVILIFGTVGVLLLLVLLGVVLVR